jgi:redox-sensitive bicupin YhaK (pirin superfamily)
VNAPIQRLTGQEKDLGGGFMVRRILPAAARRSVGPFVFFDHFGPVTEVPGVNHDVRPHPHIGLATVTYLFEGAMLHRDSIGSVQLIEPGAVNWMTAGRGIVHSERRPESLRETRYVNHGLQLWLALPREFEEVAPAFEHTPAASIPQVTLGSATVRVMVGEAFGQRSPVHTYSPTLYLDVTLPQGETLDLPVLAQEMALYVVQGELQLGDQSVMASTMAVLDASQPVRLSAKSAARLVVIGGAALDAPRAIWWNFVSSRRERIVQAADDWQAQRMGQVPGETEFIPLPEKRFTI